MKVSIILDRTKKNITRNKWLSVATIFVVAVSFLLSGFFIAASLFASKAVNYYETRAQVIIFFKSGTPESEIFKLRDKLNTETGVQSIEYTSQDDALNAYKQDFKDNPELLDTVSADILPPSLGIRASSIDYLTGIITTINKEKETNAYIDEVAYYKDVLDKIRSISQFIYYGSVVLITVLVLITLLLIVVTIGFNIMTHKEEIEIMHLVGSSDNFIRWPYILEGACYGVVGSLISALLLGGMWYGALYLIKGSDFYFWLSQFIADLSIAYILPFNWLFICIFLLIQIAVGLVFGAIGGLVAVIRYLKLKER